MPSKTNFIHLFDNDRKIVIPLVQRDYAEGRTDKHSEKVRSNFLQALYDAVTIKPITLDFIYGDLKDNGEIILLDGQQRLTTLFLLYWYAAKKAKIASFEYDFLKRFSYETRYSSRRFCEKLVEYQIDFQKNIAPSHIIEDQNWFPLGWKKDPTIRSMLVMIDCIDAKFCDVDNLWSKLNSDCIAFYFLPIKDMGLTDELYIKMNSRGKQLTEFENFKAEFESELEKTSQETAKRIALKIDSTWTDLLWSYKDAANTIDERFLKLFYLVCQIICYRSGDTLNGKDVDSFWLLNEYFNYRSKDVASNISFLESFFDGWAAIAKNQPLESFFTQYLTFLNFDGKIKLSARAYNNNLDLFGDAAISEKYTLPKLALFYAFTLLITRRAVLSEEDFRRRIRIVNNLIQNSADEISDNENRVGGNRMPAILRQIDSIILKGEINRDDTPSFNAYQLEEESSKLWLTNAHPEIAPVLFRLEDHDLLYGQIGIVGVDNVELFPRFTDLFQCSLDKVNCALMAINNYAQKEKRYTLQYQLGSSSELNSWRTLFHHGSNEGYENTKATLLALLKSSRNFSEEILDGIIDHFLIECEKNQDYNWRYYYIKYSAFRPNDYYGKYFSVGNYDSLVITTKSRCSESAYSPFLKAAQESIEKYLYLEYFHAKKNILVIGQKGYNFTKHSICIYEKDPAVTEDYYGFKSYILKQEMPLEQSIDSVDRENRIEKLIQIINSE